ncbi:hypothetical protein M3689_05835 [Alkalihalophilus marmarensis]|uniref:hypothetical protein n=1 Tax=Alkalihalophilus marmarensis TaxID=521377 RepID=UPI0020406963|nr:hypothetical protein [Alkalihalophilus marmarensis]MCM3488826.1 hypothetical protein [Alkalihalophilus marmarensis]
MKQVKLHVEQIQQLIKEQYGVEVFVEIKGHQVDPHLAKKIVSETERAIGGEVVLADSNQGTKWSGFENSRKGIDVAMFWKEG